MLQLTNYAVSYTALPVLVTASLILALGLIVWIGEHGSGVSGSFLAMTVSATIWLTCYGIAYSTPSATLALWWFKAGHVGVVFIPSLVYVFTLTMVQRLREQGRLALVALAASLAFVLSVWATPQFVRGVAKFSWGYYPQYGPVSVPFLLFFVVVLANSLGWYVAEYRRAVGKIHKRRLRALLVAFGVGYLGSLDYVACYGVPLYPFGYLPIFGFIILAARAIWRYRLTDLTPALAADTIVETMNDALIVCDAEGLIRFANEATCATFRFGNRALIGQPLDVLARAHPAQQADLRALLEREMVQDHELQLWTQDGQPVDVSLSMARLRRKSGPDGLQGSVLIARDIRQRKRGEQKERQLASAAQAAASAVKRRAEELSHAYEELKRTQAMLVQAEKMAAVGQLASGTAHEVRNPLSIIRLGTEHLERLLGKPASGQAAEVLSMIKEAITRSDRIIRSLLDFSRPTPLELKPLALGDVITSALELAEKQLSAQHVEVAVTVETDLPAVLVDENHMKQVFINLILNAFQAMPDGGTLRIRCGSRVLLQGEAGVGLRSRDVFQPEERVVVCEVCDSGIGIPKEALRKVFDPFFTTKAPGQGTGLGLTITRTIVEQHGGLITVESQEGQGTCVRITLPIATAAGSRHETATTGSNGASPHG